MEGGREDGKEGGRGGGADTELKTKTPHVNVGNDKLLGNLRKGEVLQLPP